MENGSIKCYGKNEEEPVKEDFTLYNQNLVDFLGINLFKALCI